MPQTYAHVGRARQTISVCTSRWDMTSSCHARPHLITILPLRLIPPRAHKLIVILCNVPTNTLRPIASCLIWFIHWSIIITSTLRNRTWM